MDILVALLYVVEVVSCLLLALVVMLQKPKEGGLGGLAGGMGEAVFGADAGNVLIKVTVWLGAIFLVNTLLLARFTSSPTRGVRHGVSNSSRLPRGRCESGHPDHPRSSPPRPRRPPPPALRSRGREGSRRRRPRSRGFEAPPPRPRSPRLRRLPPPLRLRSPRPEGPRAAPAKGGPEVPAAALEAAARRRTDFQFRQLPEACGRISLRPHFLYEKNLHPKQERVQTNGHYFKAIVTSVHLTKGPGRTQDIFLQRIRAHDAQCSPGRKVVVARALPRPLETPLRRGLRRPSVDEGGDVIDIGLASPRELFGRTFPLQGGR